MAFGRVQTVAIVFVALLLPTIKASPSGRILGGSDAGTTQFAYAVSVRLNNAHICGGTLLSTQHVLTAAHCLYEANARVSANQVTVRVGSTNQFAGGQIHDVAAIVEHPNYLKFENDIAILRLTKVLTFTTRIASIEMATKAAEIPAADAKVTIAGWGEQATGSAPFKLQYAVLPVASEDKCLDAYSEHDESTFCVTHESKQGSCYGDAGNGAVYNGKLVGVNVFIVGACGAIYPDVFLNVAHYNPWIQSVINA